MRALVHPRPGYLMCGIDYSAQEVYLAGLLSNDKKLISAYETGDPYIAICDELGMKHEDRPVAKQSFLGMMYGMGPESLAIRVAKNTGRNFTPRDAGKMIDKIFSKFYVFRNWRIDTVKKYYRDRKLKSLDGWIMFGDNENERSVINFPIQSAGASILRAADKLAFQRGLKVVFTQHDAFYAEYREDDDQVPKALAQCMQDGFQYYFPNRKVRMDTKIWGGEKKNIEAPEEYEFFKKYFSNHAEIL